MKNITNWIVLIIFLAPFDIYPQSNHKAANKGFHGKNSSPFSERAPGSVPGNMQYSDDYYDLQFEYACADASGEAGIECDGNYFYTTKWNGTGNFFKYDVDGTFLGQIDIAGAAGVRDLAYDGIYMYGAAANTSLFEMDFENHLLVSTITAPVEVRAIAYDDKRRRFLGQQLVNKPHLIRPEWPGVEFFSN